MVYDTVNVGFCLDSTVVMFMFQSAALKYLVIIWVKIPRVSISSFGYCRSNVSSEKYLCLYFDVPEV